MDGTQMPTNMAAFISPLKNNISEKISERKAAVNNNLSVIVNFLNIALLGFKNCIILTNSNIKQKSIAFVFSGHIFILTSKREATKEHRKHRFKCRLRGNYLGGSN